ncbi:MAG: type II secretion system F family protein [Anaerolineae bacterium]
MQILLLLMGLLVVGVVLFMILRGARASQSLEDRLNELASLGEPVSLEDLELSQPFTQRVIMPMLQHMGEALQRLTPKQNLEQARQKLEVAGLAHSIKPAQFYAARIAASVILGILGLVFALTGAGTPLYQRVLFGAGGFVLGYFLPPLLLTSKIQRRQEEVLKALPDALDLLTICVEAGLGFDAAMSKVAEKWDNELSLAFTRTVQQMQLGKLRREALRDMANSLDVSDVTSFVAAIIQADQLGVSMAKVMRIQSEQMRVKRRQRAEEKARQAPVKIMIPLAFCIFPSILIVLLGPAVLQIKESGIFGGF